jgi:hypothetical protein
MRRCVVVPRAARRRSRSSRQGRRRPPSRRVPRLRDPSNPSSWQTWVAQIDEPVHLITREGEVTEREDPGTRWPFAAHVTVFDPKPRLISRQDPAGGYPSTPTPRRSSSTSSPTGARWRWSCSSTLPAASLGADSSPAADRLRAGRTPSNELQSCPCVVRGHVPPTGGVSRGARWVGQRRLAWEEMPLSGGAAHFE